MLLYDYLLGAPESPLEPAVAAVEADVAARARRRGEPVPSRRAVRRQLATLVAFLEELGVLRWRPGPRDLGSVSPTFLGLFGWMLVVLDLEGPTPEIERMLAEHGFLLTDDGLCVHRDDVPVPICDN